LWHTKHAVQLTHFSGNRLFSIHITPPLMTQWLKAPLLVDVSQKVWSQSLSFHTAHVLRALHFVQKSTALQFFFIY